jgi:hypothetical protein
MNSKERFDFYKSKGLERREAEDVIIGLVNRLIESLYIPTGENLQWVIDPDRLRLFKIEQEPVNWGDIKCYEVLELKNGNFIVKLDEASPGACPTFCAYIETYMKKWGWNVECQTEW